MKETVAVIWGICAFLSTFGLAFLSKKQNRRLGKYDMLYKLFFMVLSLATGWAVFSLAYGNSSNGIVWLSRASVLLIGLLNVWLMYKRKWTKRSATIFEDDSLFVELLFVMVGAFLISIAFCLAPRMFGITPLDIEVTRPFWDLPVYYILPFVGRKIIDLAGQFPLKQIENPWVFPIEKVNPESWPWRDLMQVNFEVKDSLVNEYGLFAWNGRPWIEAPKEIALAKVFQLCIQERRNRNDLTTVQDLGDEYGGTPQFCWLFRLKRVWYDPTSWFNSNRILNPDLPIGKQSVKSRDIILAKRIPGDGSKGFGTQYSDIDEHDLDKTVLIKR